MKRVYAVFLFLSVAVMLHAEPYGILEHAVDNPTYGIDLFLAGQPIRYAVAADITPKEKQIFINNLRAWPKKTLQAIPKNRTQEFGDILPLLSRQMMLEETTDDNADIILQIGQEKDFAGNSEEDEAAGLHTASYPHIITINPAYRHRFDEISLHEIGHFYGMADQYPQAHNASQQYYGSVNRTEYSIMYSLTNDSFHQEFTCDDADGFINLIDLRFFQQKGHFSSRAAHGWRSLCTDNLEYQKSTKRKGSFLDGKIFRTSHNVLPLFTTQIPRTIQRDSQTQVVTDMSDRSVISPCPADATGWRVFMYDKAYELLNIYCVKGQNRPEPGTTPDFLFPLPTATEWEVEIQDNNSIHLEFSKQKLKSVSLTLLHSNVAGQSHVSISLTNFLLGKHPHTDVEIFHNGERFFTTIPLNNNRELLRAHPVFGIILFKLKQELDQQTRYAINFDKDFYQPLIQTPQRRAYEESLTRQMPTMLKPTPQIPFAP